MNVEKCYMKKNKNKKPVCVQHQMSDELGKIRGPRVYEKKIKDKINPVCVQYQR